MGYEENQKQLAKLGIISNDAADRAIAQNNAALTTGGTTQRWKSAFSSGSKDVNSALNTLGGAWSNIYLKKLPNLIMDINKPIWERESTKKVLGEDGAQQFKETVENIPVTIVDAIDQGLKESTQPIWERDSTVKVLGKDGADKLQDVFNPARWGENAIDSMGVSDTTKDNLKKYLPVALAGGAALLLITALK